MKRRSFIHSLSVAGMLPSFASQQLNTISSQETVKNDPIACVLGILLKPTLQLEKLWKKEKMP